jgi:hypothetical protein
MEGPATVGLARACSRSMYGTVPDCVHAALHRTVGEATQSTSRRVSLRPVLVRIPPSTPFKYGTPYGRFEADIRLPAIIEEAIAREDHAEELHLIADAIATHLRSVPLHDNRWVTLKGFRYDRGVGEWWLTPEGRRR